MDEEFSQDMRKNREFTLPGRSLVNIYAQDIANLKFIHPRFHEMLGIQTKGYPEAISRCLNLSLFSGKTK